MQSQMQKKDNGIIQLLKNYYIVKVSFRPKYVILAIVFVATENLSHLFGIFFNQDFIIIHIIISPYIIKFVKIHRTKFIGKVHSNLFFREDCKLKSKKFDFVRDLNYIFVFI